MPHPAKDHLYRHNQHYSEFKQQLYTHTLRIAHNIGSQFTGINDLPAQRGGFTILSLKCFIKLVVTTQWLTL